MPEQEQEGHCHTHGGGSERPMFATVTVAVCHCGAGCLLGDIVGEWLVYGTGAKINGESIWVEFLVGMDDTTQPNPTLPSCLEIHQVSKKVYQANCGLLFFSSDYGFAIFFGVFFQYFSIAPMSGNWGLTTIWRSLKADFLSLTSFQVGLYGWIAIYQIAIWNYELRMNNVVYWWMMQVSCIESPYIVVGPILAAC